MTFGSLAGSRRGNFEVHLATRIEQKNGRGIQSEIMLRCECDFASIVYRRTVREGVADEQVPLQSLSKTLIFLGIACFT